MRAIQEAVASRGAVRRGVAIAAAAAVLGCASRSAAAQRDYVRMMRPAQVRSSAGAVRPAELKVLTVRAYADADYQAQVEGWQTVIREQVRRASEISEAQFGVRLSLESTRPWARPARAKELGGALHELEETDPARDVDWVVGFVSASHAPSAARDHVGMARIFGRHFVLRAMEAPGDAERFAGSFHELSEAERAAFLRDRREHMETETLLHEWAHTLGAVHECPGKWIMSPTYTVLAEEFSPESAHLVRAGLEHRGVAGDEGRRAWADAYRRAARKSADAAWDCREQEQGLASAQALLDRKPRP